MCAVVVLALILLPAAGGALGYARDGAMGGWLGGLGGLAAALVLGGAPLALLFNGERKKLARERAERPEDRMDA